MRRNIISAIIAVIIAVPLCAATGKARDVKAQEASADLQAAVAEIEAQREAEEERWYQIETGRIPPETIASAEQYNDPEIPDDIEASAYKWGKAYGIAPELLESIAYYESRYLPWVKNGGCIGLMQISAYWHRDRMARLGVTDLYDADQNMHVAADLLAELYRQHNNTAWVLMKYSGDSRADAVLQGGQMSEHVRKVIEKAITLEEEHAAGAEEG